MKEVILTAKLPDEKLAVELQDAILTFIQTQLTVPLEEISLKIGDKYYFSLKEN